MATTPSVHKAEPELTDEQKLFIEQRIGTADEDAEDAVPLRPTLKEDRKQLKPLGPR